LVPGIYRGRILIGAVGSADHVFSQFPVADDFIDKTLPGAKQKIERIIVLTPSTMTISFTICNFYMFNLAYKHLYING